MPEIMQRSGAPRHSYLHSKESSRERQRIVVLVYRSQQGRCRFKVKGLYRSPQLSLFLREGLLSQQGIQNVKADILTSSIVIVHKKNIGVGALKKMVHSLVMEAVEKALKGQPLKFDSSAGREPWYQADRETTVAHFKTNEEKGLEPEEAKRRLQIYGANQLTAVLPPAPWKLLVQQFTNLPVGLLLGSSVISVFTGGLLEAGLIIGVVAVNGYLGYVTERRARDTLSSLDTGRVEVVLVWRGGHLLSLPETELVPGDVIDLREGEVPCDIRLIEAKQLQIDEASLTGESLPVSKNADAIGEKQPISGQKNMAFKGTVVTRGQGRGIVVATGDSTQLGVVSSLVGHASTPQTPLELQVERLGQQVVLGSVGICAGVFLLGIFRGQGFLQMLSSSVSLAVAAIPEGLPAVGTTTMAYGIRKLAKRGINVRNLSSVEALGSIETLCLDKTGTITENRMEVEQTWLLSEASESGLICLRHVVALCSDVIISPEGLQGSATEVALVKWGQERGCKIESIRAKWPRQRTRYRSEASAVMFTYHRCEEEKDILIAAKGNPTEVLDRCQTYMSDKGVLPLSPEIRREIMLANDAMQGQALRVLGFAYGRHRRKLTWVGLLGLADPIRAGSADLISRFHKAGIDTVMLTGDQETTARAIAKKLGIQSKGHLVVAPMEWMKGEMTPEDMDEQLADIHVFPRVSPAQKLKIVEALQKRGSIIAMTGDGINDTPALKAAHVGIAIPSQYNDAACKAADVVLLDGDLFQLYQAIAEGRATRDNIKNSIQFLLTTNLSEIAVSLVGIGLGWGSVFNPMQLLWINLMTDLFPSLSYAYDKPRQDIMSHPPVDPDDPLFSKNDMNKMALRSGIISLGTLVSYAGKLNNGKSVHASSTRAFATLTTAQLAEAYAGRWRPGSQSPFNPFLMGSVVLGGLLMLMGINQPQLRMMLKHVPMNSSDWLLAIGCGLGSTLINEIAAGKNSQGLLGVHDAR